MIFSNKQLHLSLMALAMVGSPLRAETFTPAPVPDRAHATAAAAPRTFDYASPVADRGGATTAETDPDPSRRSPAPPGSQGDGTQGPGPNGTAADPGEGGGGFQGPFGQDTGVGQDANPGKVLEQTSPADPGSVTSNNRAPGQPRPPFQFPPMGGGGGSSGGGGGGGGPQMPQFQQIPTFPGAQMAAPISEQNLSQQLGAATSQMGQTLDGARLTALTDALGKQMNDLQTSFMGIMQTQTQTAVQGLINAGKPLTNQLGGFSGQIAPIQNIANTPRVGTSTATTSTNTLQPRSNFSPTNDLASTTSRSPASSSGGSGQRGRLFTTP